MTSAPGNNEYKSQYHRYLFYRRVRYTGTKGWNLPVWKSVPNSAHLKAFSACITRRAWRIHELHNTSRHMRDYFQNVAQLLVPSQWTREIQKPVCLVLRDFPRPKLKIWQDFPLVGGWNAASVMSFPYYRMEEPRRTSESASEKRSDFLFLVALILCSELFAGNLQGQKTTSEAMPRSVWARFRLCTCLSRNAAGFVLVL